ncbi:MAG: SpoIIE family protein phosphatase [Candidatus Sulfotelmatobacter sp.]
MRDFYWKLRAWMVEAGLWPQGWVARAACYSLVLALGLFLLEMLLGLFAPAASGSLGGWVKFLLFDAALLFSIVAFRWLKGRILWRLRNRLIVTYVFIGVIPAVLLVAMALIAIYLFAGQFASFVVTSEINSQLRSMQAVNAAVGNELASRIEKSESPTAESLVGLRKRDRAWGRRRVCAWQGTRLLLTSGSTENPAAMTFPDFLDKSDSEFAKAALEGKPFKEIVRDQGELYLRVASVFNVGGEKLTVVTGEPLDKNLVADIAADLGEITLDAAGIGLENTPPARNGGNDSTTKTAAGTASAGKSDKDRFTYSQNADGVKIEGGGQVVHPRPMFTVGTLAPPSSITDREITFGTPLSVVDWKGGERSRAGALVQVRTRPSVLYSHLFASLGDFAIGVEYILLAVIVIFAVIELIALIIGTRMTRTVTGAVAQLYDATKNVDRGDFSHRIPVKSDDQLAQLSLSFNSMTESIEKLILEQKEKQRLEGELAIAQEVQAQLFPRQVSELESLEVHGFCRPARTVSGDYYDFLTASSHKLILAARTVSGDYYDFLTASSHKLILAVGDISGKGISAALLMATIHSAVRAYTLESMPQLREPIAVGAVLREGRITAAWPEGVEVSPGALLSLLNHQLYESEDGAVRRLEAGGTVIGLFDNMTYDEGSVEMHPGEIFLAYSDGVTEPENEFGEFGEERLIDLVSENRHLPLVQVSQAVTSAVDDWIGDNEQPDDITLVLARAR